MGLNKFRVLLVDNDKDAYFVLRDLVEEITNRPYSLTWKSSFQDGLESLLKKTYDACLVDDNLGENSGLDFLQEAMQLDIICPIILLSSQRNFDLDLQAMNAGAADFLVKENLNSLSLEKSLRYSMKRALDIQELFESERNFKILFNSTFEGIAVHDQGIIVDANQCFGDIFNLHLTKILGSPLSNFIPQKYINQITTKIDSDETNTFDCMVHHNGKDLFIEVSDRKVMLNHKLCSLIAIKDLTQRKHMEAQILQQDRLASLGLLASSLAHEIGNPLGVIRGRAQHALSKAMGNESLESDMKTITSQIDRISKLVHALLHLARGNKAKSIERANLHQVVESVLSLVKFELAEKNINLEVDVPSNIFVKSEASQLSQVFLNLIINAIHAIEEAIKRGSTAAHKISIMAYSADNIINISVQDTGVGIPQENMTELFKPFFTTKAIGEGTGLGLVTSYKLIESWGGSIVASSPKGSGANFTFSLNSTS